MTDKETMQWAIDALNMYQTTLRAVVKATGEQHAGNPSIVIQALEKAIARPERRPLTGDAKLSLIEKHIKKDSRLGFHCSLFSFIEGVEAAHGIKETE